MQRKERPDVHGPLQPVAPAVPARRLSADIKNLMPDDCLIDNGRFRVYCVPAERIPSCLQEIGRLREITFRAAGEGTRNATDIDLFDSYYLHLFVWDPQEAAIVGAYRLGLTDEILARYGEHGLYTSTLFNYGPQVLERLNPGIECGRSFIREEYQKSYAPLLLLWQGIFRYAARTPRYAVLFGAVSISNGYTPLSRALLVEFLETHTSEPTIAAYVKPRRPFRAQRPRRSDELDLQCVSDIDEVSRVVSHFEPDNKGVPVLLRQYLKLGGRMLGFNTDERFSDVVDGLIWVDMRLTETRLLEKYMGKQGAAAFLAYHADALRIAS